MDHLGAMIGPLLAVLLLTQVTTDLRVLFVVAAVPGALAAAVLLFAWEPARERSTPPPLRFDRAEMWVLAPFVVGAAGNLADAFLMLAVGVDAQAPLVALPVVWILLNLVRSTLSTPAGWLADRWPGEWIVAISYATRALAAVLLETAKGATWTAAVVVFSGLGALSDGAEKKVVSVRLGAVGQGSAFGLYHVGVGLAGMVGALVIGGLWDTYGAPSALAWSAGWSLLAAVWVLASRRGLPPTGPAAPAR